MFYQLIILPFVAALISQVIKMIINGVKGQFTWKDLNSYGGMPSSHSAIVTALAVAIGYYEGWTSAVFAIAFIVAFITIRDAAGFRMILGKHAEEINQVVHEMASIQSYKFPHLKERIGHKPFEIIVGMAIGILTVLIGTLIF